MSTVTEAHKKAADDFYVANYKGRLLNTADDAPLGKVPKTVVKLKELMAQAKADGGKMQEAANAYFKEKGFKVGPKTEAAPAQKKEEKAEVKVSTTFVARGAKPGTIYKLADGTLVEATGKESQKTVGAFLFRRPDGKFYALPGDTKMTEASAKPEQKESKKAEAKPEQKPAAKKVEAVQKTEATTLAKDAVKGKQYRNGTELVEATGQASKNTAGAFLFKHSDGKFRPILGTVALRDGAAAEKEPAEKKEEQRQEHVAPAGEVLDPTKMDKAVLRAAIDELKKGGHSVEWSKTESEQQLRDKISGVLTTLYTAEVTKQVELIDPNKEGFDCIGVLPDLTSPSCIACPSKPECLRLFQLSIKESFKAWKKWQDGAPAAEKKEAPSAAEKPTASGVNAKTAVAVAQKTVEAVDAVKGGVYSFNGKTFTGTGQPSKNTAGAFLFTNADGKVAAVSGASKMLAQNALAYGADEDTRELVDALLGKPPGKPPATVKELAALIGEHYEIGEGAEADKAVAEWLESLKAAGILK